MGGGWRRGEFICGDLRVILGFLVVGFVHFFGGF